MNSSTFAAITSLMTMSSAEAPFLTFTATAALRLVPSVVVATRSVEPTPTPVTTPSWSMVATFSSLDSQVTFLNMAFSGVMVAWHCVFSDTMMSALSMVAVMPFDCMNSPPYSNLKLSKQHQLE